MKPTLCWILGRGMVPIVTQQPFGYQIPQFCIVRWVHSLAVHGKEYIQFPNVEWFFCYPGNICLQECVQSLLKFFLLENIAKYYFLFVRISFCNFFFSEIETCLNLKQIKKCNFSPIIEFSFLLCELVTPKKSTSQVLCVGTKSAQRTQNQFELGNELMSAEIFNWILVHHHYQPEEGRGMSFLVSSTPLLNVRKSAIEEESAFVARSFDAGWGHITWLHLMSVIQLCCVYLCWCDLLAVVVVESSESKRC